MTATFTRSPDDRIYLRGFSRLRVPRDAAGFWNRSGVLAGVAAAHAWIEARSGAPRARCPCGEPLRQPVGWEHFDGQLVAADGERLDFELDTGARRCTCDRLSLRRPREILELFLDIVAMAELPAGSTHVGQEEEAARRRAEVWRVDPAEAARIPAPHFGRASIGRRRYFRPASGNRQCHECTNGDGACFVCGGTGREAGARAECCNGSGRCILCRGSGQLSI